MMAAVACCRFLFVLCVQRISRLEKSLQWFASCHTYHLSYAGKLVHLREIQGR